MIGKRDGLGDALLGGEGDDAGHRSQRSMAIDDILTQMTSRKDLSGNAAEEESTVEQVVAQATAKRKNTGDLPDRLKITKIDVGNKVKAAKAIPFFMLIVIWLVLVTLVFGIAVWAVEGGSVSFVDSCFLICNAVTTTGLSPIDFSSLSSMSQFFIAVAIQLGSGTMFSLLPVIIRIRSLWRIIKPVLHCAFAALCPFNPLSTPFQPSFPMAFRWALLLTALKSTKTYLSGW